MSTSVQSRRAVLTTALGAAGAATAAALAGPAVALAANGDAIKAGEEHTATRWTVIENTTAGVQEAGFCGRAAGVGVLGESVSGQGVVGRSTSGTGVQGYSDTGAGLNGFGGPYGLWADGDAIGAQGRSWTGIGVRGEATTGVGVYATATTGAALEVAGKAKYSRSGRATVPQEPRVVDITVAGGLNSAQHGPRDVADLPRRGGGRGRPHQLPERRQGPDLPHQGRLDNLEHLRRLVCRGVLRAAVARARVAPHDRGLRRSAVRAWRGRPYPA